MNNQEFDGSIVPNDGEAFQTPAQIELKKEISEEKAMIKSAEPLLDRIFAFLDEQIAFASDISSIDISSDDIKAQVMAQSFLKDRLYAVKNDLENLKSAHLDKS